jgi:hypothetical protein
MTLQGLRSAAGGPRLRLCRIICTQSERKFQLCRKPDQDTPIVLRWSHGRSPPPRGSPRGAWPWTGISVKRIEKGGSRGLAPACCLPLWGREGVTLIIFTGTNQNDFYRAKIPVLVIPGHRNALPPPRGQGWRKGGDHHGKREFLQSTF